MKVIFLPQPGRWAVISLLLLGSRNGHAQCPVANPVTVSNNSNSGVGSLRWAITCVNGANPLTNINFSLSGTIQPTSALPAISKTGAWVDGTGQEIILDGSSISVGANGLTLAGSNVIVQGLDVRDFNGGGNLGHGIFIQNGNNNTVQDNRLANNRVGIGTSTSVSTFSMTGNVVGLDNAGIPLGNTAAGIAIQGNPGGGVVANNVVAHNNGPGVSIIGGTVLISNNSIYCNTTGGITRPSPPAPPNITLSTNQLIRGSAAVNQVVEVFRHSTAGCPAAPCQGKDFLGTVTTPASGIWSLPLPAGAVSSGDMVTATQTQGGNNTSAFATCKTIADCSTFTAGIDQINVSCPGGSDGSATATPTSPAFTYLWEGGATTSTISNLAAGVYTVTVTNAAGCSDTQMATITAPPALSLNVNATGETGNGTSDGTVTALSGGGTPPYAYIWNPTGNTTFQVSGLAPGMYTVTVADQNGCTITASATVNAFSCAGFQATISKSEVSCFGGSNGSATALPVNGQSNYVFTWSNGQSMATATGLIAGTYTVIITDQAGCITTQNTTITQPDALSLAVASTAETGLNTSDGSATAMPLGGTPPISYTWNTGATAAQIPNLAPGLYAVTIVDANGCMATGSATVAAGSGSGCTALPVYAVLAPAQVCGHTPFTLEADDLFPHPAVRYVWRLPNGDTVVTIQPMLDVTATSGAFSGEYFVLRDSAGCRSLPVGGAAVSVLTVEDLFAGNDTVVCTAGLVMLKADLPSAGSGTWFPLGAATVDAPASNPTVGRNLQPGPNAFVWQVSLGICPQAGTDTVTYFLEKKPIAKDDQYTLQRAYDVAVMEVLLNDALGGLPDTLLQLISPPAQGQLELLTTTRRFRYTVEEEFRGTVTFQYAVCSPASVCNLPCDTATVTISLLNLPTVPSGLVVEDSGPNGQLTIRGINGFTRVEMIITDRWGDLVFRELDYDNNAPWTGDYQRTGKYLAGGAYYYFLKAYDGQTQVGNTLSGVIHLFDK